MIIGLMSPSVEWGPLIIRSLPVMRRYQYMYAIMGTPSFAEEYALRFVSNTTEWIPGHGDNLISDS